MDSTIRFPTCSWDPATAEDWEEFDKRDFDRNNARSFHFKERELEAFQQNGFVVSPRTTGVVSAFIGMMRGGPVVDVQEVT